MDAVSGVRLVIAILILTLLASPFYLAVVPLDGDYSDTESVEYTRTVSVTMDAPSDNKWPTLPKQFTPMLERYVMPDDPAVRQVADALEAYGERWDCSERRLAEVAKRWVTNNIRYTPDSEVHGWDDYWQTPYQTLRLGTGDCEDMTVLYVSICEALGIGCVLVSEKDHVSAAVLVDSQESDSTVSFGGRTYVTAETTNTSSLGSGKLGSHLVYPTHAGLAVALILLADLLVIGLVLYVVRGVVFRWIPDSDPLRPDGNPFSPRFYTGATSALSEPEWFLP